MSTHPPRGTPLERKTDGLSINEAAKQLGVHAQTVRNWIRNGQLPVTRFGPNRGVIRIHPEDIERMRRPPE